MAKGRRRDEPPQAVDPWANLARIEAALRARGLGDLPPGDDDLPGPLLGNPEPTPSAGSRPAPTAFRAEAGSEGPLRRDRSRLRATGHGATGLGGNGLGGNGHGGNGHGGNGHGGNGLGGNGLGGNGHGGNGHGENGHSAAGQGSARLQQSRLTIGPSRRPTASGRTGPEAAPAPSPSVPEALLTPRALRFTDLPETPETAPPPAPPPTRPVPSRPVEARGFRPEQPGPVRLGASAPPPDLDFDLVLNDPAPPARARLGVPGRRRGSSPRRPAKPPRSATSHPSQPRLTTLFRVHRVPVVAALVVICLVVLVVGIGTLTRQRTPGVTRTETASQQLSDTPKPSASPSVPGRSPGTGTTGPTAAQARKVQLGVFRGTSPAAVTAFGTWLGRTPEVAVDFSARDTWEHIADPDYMIAAWRNTKYRVVYSTAMLPDQGGATVAAGSRGSYDHYYERLARNLVNAGEKNAIIRLGWEFNLDTSNWSTPNAKQWVAYWRHIVTAMRSVPGQKFQFDWNPNIGDTEYDATLYWPGAQYVDYVGVDVYDVSWDANTYPYPVGCSASCAQVRREAVWQRLRSGVNGLNFWAQFARDRGKPMSLPEWGLWKRPDGHGGNDNPYFVQQMWRFIADPANKVAYQAYFETVGDDGNHRMMTTLTQAGKAYRKLFGT